MEIEKEYAIYCIESRIKDLNGMINSIGTEEDSGEPLKDLQDKIKALTNLLEMI